MKDLLKNGQFIAFKYPEHIYDNEKLFFYSVECRIDINENSEIFKPEKIKYQTIVEVDEENKEYIMEFLFLFRKPEKEEIFDFLCKTERYEDIIRIENGESYSQLLTKEQQKQAASELYAKLMGK